MYNRNDLRQFVFDDTVEYNELIMLHNIYKNPLSPVIIFGCTDSYQTKTVGQFGKYSNFV